MQFDIITIFPDAFKSYFSQSILWRAQDKKFAKINIHNLRDWTFDKYKKVDDRPYGGGAGMILKIEPIYKAVQYLKSKRNKFLASESKNKKSKIILFSVKGKKFDQKVAKSLSKLDRIIMICGHYEGVDERVAKNIADMELSVGDYILTGGEIPAMVVVDAVTRLIPGVIKEKSLKEESFSFKNRRSSFVKTTEGKNAVFEYPQYTRPEVFTVPAEARRAKAGSGKKEYWKVPKVLLTGHHQKIKDWRKKKSR